MKELKAYVQGSECENISKHLAAIILQQQDTIKKQEKTIEQSRELAKDSADLFTSMKRKVEHLEFKIQDLLIEFENHKLGNPDCSLKIALALDDIEQ